MVRELDVLLFMVNLHWAATLPVNAPARIDDHR
jgi:hypothetical protein